MSSTAANPAPDTSQARLDWLFPSPVMVHDWPDSEPLNEALRQAVRARRASTVGVVKTNRGGWQSDTDLQSWGDAATQQLVQRMVALVREYVARQAGGAHPAFASGWTVRAWANINEHGHFNRAHDHLGPKSFVSGVYYVDVGDIESGQVAGGRTRFEDWTRVAIDVHENTDPLRRDQFMDPRNGRMLLFPASLMHSVEPYQGHAQRMTIAFNLYHPGLAVPRLAQHLEQSDWWWTNFRGLVLLKRKLPEKLYALGLLPGRLLQRASSGEGRDASLGQRLRTAWGHATALASERFEARRNA
jgi:uncharacterized protein (TIGR02466 family)